MAKKNLHLDRKILRGIDRNISKHGCYKWVGFLSMYFLVATTGHFYADYSLIALVLGGAFLFLAATEFFLFVRFDNIYGAGPGRWRRLFVFSHLVSAVVWAFFMVFILFAYPLSVSSFLVILLAVGICGIGNVEWSPYHNINVVFQNILFIPTVLVLVSTNDINAYVTSAIMLTMLVIFVRQSRELHERFWTQTRASHHLEETVRDLNQVINETDQRRQVKADFLTSIIHETRTPMNNVLGMLALLDDTQLSSQQKQFQDVAVQSGESLIRFMDDVLDFSKIVSGAITLSESVFSLRRCFDQCQEVLGPLAHRNGVDISVIFDPNLPIRVEGDRERLAQIITHMGTNAIRLNGGREIVVHVGMEKTGSRQGKLTVQIINVDSKLSEAVVNSVFEVFNRAGSLLDMQEGKGLGLAIAKGLSECMGGEVGFENKPGVGAVFSFKVALKISTQQAEKREELLKVSGKKRAMIVGAPEGLESMLATELERWNITLNSVPHADKLMEQLKTAQRHGHAYDVVFINCPLRETYQMTLRDQILSDDELRDTKLIILTSLAQRDMEVESEHLMPDTVEWLTKPVTRISLRKVLAKLFGLTEASLEKAAGFTEQVVREENDKRILLVEDNKVNQMVAKGLLNKLGYQVTIANNGNEAISLFDQKIFDLILMDCLMPEVDGYEATGLIRARETGEEHIPIVAMTASVLEGEKNHCLSAGMDDYLAKPVNIEDLAAMLRQWLGATKKV